MWGGGGKIASTRGKLDPIATVTLEIASGSDSFVTGMVTFCFNESSEYWQCLVPQQEIPPNTFETVGVNELFVVVTVDSSFTTEQAVARRIDEIHILIVVRTEPIVTNCRILVPLTHLWRLCLVVSEKVGHLDSSRFS
jgi:hypothetical protein